MVSPITYYWTVPLILDHSYLVRKSTSSKIADKKVSGFLEILKLLFQQCLKLSSSERDMSGPILGTLPNNRWSRGTFWWSLILLRGKKKNNIRLRAYLPILPWFGCNSASKFGVLSQHQIFMCFSWVTKRTEHFWSFSEDSYSRSTGTLTIFVLQETELSLYENWVFNCTPEWTSRYASPACG